MRTLKHEGLVLLLLLFFFTRRLLATPAFSCLLNLLFILQKCMSVMSLLPPWIILGSFLLFLKFLFLLKSGCDMPALVLLIASALLLDVDTTILVVALKD